jgi:enediyne biosynthesis protein E7
MSSRPNAPPPGPGLLGGFHRLIKLLSGDMSLYEDLFDRYGDTVRLRSPQGDDIVMAFHPDDVQRVLLDHNKNYPKGRRYNELERVLGRGLVNSEGEFWQRQRRLVQPLFNRGSVLALVPIIGRHADRMLAAWGAAGETGERDVGADLLRATFNIAGEAFFGSAIDGHTDAVRENFKFALSVALRRMYAPVNPPIEWPLPSHVRFRRAMAEIDRVIYDIIDSYRPEDGADHVLARLISAVDPETGERMDRRQLRDEVDTILMVGHETSSVTVTWALYLLTRHPDVCRRLVEEIDTELGGDEPDVDSLGGLHYLNLVVSEALRVLPSVPFILRQSVNEDRLGGYRIRPGSTICISPWVTHRHPEFWPDPQRFDPSRFEHFDRKTAHRCAYIPFGAGPRTCIGEFMAQLEVKMIVVKVLQRYTLELAPGFEPVCRGFISLHPITGMRMVYRRRRDVTPRPSGQGAADCPFTVSHTQESGHGSD